jgi:hypothetical protein
MRSNRNDNSALYREFAYLLATRSCIAKMNLYLFCTVTFCCGNHMD